jgi:hypothetical protein
VDGVPAAVVDARSADVSNIVFAEIRGVPRDRAVAGVVVEDGQAAPSRANPSSKILKHKLRAAVGQQQAMAS